MPLRGPPQMTLTSLTTPIPPSSSPTSTTTTTTTTVVDSPATATMITRVSIADTPLGAAQADKRSWQRMEAVGDTCGLPYHLLVAITPSNIHLPLANYVDWLLTCIIIGISFEFFPHFLRFLYAYQ
jgi:hypothetical protein